MKFLGMVLVNCKKYFKDYRNIIIMFILPFLTVFMVNFFLNNSKDGLDVKLAIINLDKGDSGKKLINSLGSIDTFTNKEQALKELKNYSYIAVYEIPQNFSELIDNNIKPTINSYKIETGNNTQVFEANLEQKVNRLVKVKVLENSGITFTEKELDKNILSVQYKLKPGLLSRENLMPILLILFYLIGFSGNFSSDLLNLRKSRILERFLSMNNRGYEIMGSIYLSMLIVQCTMYTAAFAVIDVVFKYSFQNFGMLILNIILMSTISISLSVMLTRIFKDASIVSFVLSIISLVMFSFYIVGMISESSHKIPAAVLVLSKFTPFYWSMDSIERSVVFPNVFVLLLIALVFFSAGSIKYSRFAKDA